MKQDLNGVRTPEDVMRRLADNVKITSDEVNGLSIEVSKKVGDDEIISKINQSGEQIGINASKIKLEGYTTINDGFSIDEQGNMTCKDASMENVNINEGILNMTDANGSLINIGAFEGITVTDNSLLPLEISHTAIYSAEGINCYDDDSGFPTAYYHYAGMGFTDPENPVNSTFEVDGYTGNVECSGNITANSFIPTSLEEKKKNFEKLENALDIVKDTEIYKYNLKTEADGDKKHVGFVIGKNFKYRKELTDLDNKGVDLYSMISVLWKAVQEQQVEIEKLKEGKK